MYVLFIDNVTCDTNDEKDIHMCGIDNAKKKFKGLKGS